MDLRRAVLQGKEERLLRYTDKGLSFELFNLYWGRNELMYFLKVLEVITIVLIFCLVPHSLR